MGRGSLTFLSRGQAWAPYSQPVKSRGDPLTLVGDVDLPHLRKGPGEIPFPGIFAVI